jgi:NADPH2:quinone reductase
VSGGAGLLASYVIVLAKAAGLRVLADAKPEDDELVRGFELAHEAQRRMDAGGLRGRLLITF